MSLEKWHQNLQLAFDFGIPHISSYALTVEPKTALDNFIKKGTYPPLDEELALKHFELLVTETQKNGYIQYEISNFGKPGFYSKHNTSYWQGAFYLGIGPSAHSFNGSQRSWNLANNVKYILAIKNNHLPLTIEELSEKDRFNEYVMTGLRTIWGISLNKIESQFGLEYKQYVLSASKQFIDKGLLQTRGDVMTITPKGKFLADGIASELFSV